MMHNDSMGKDDMILLLEGSLDIAYSVLQPPECIQETLFDEYNVSIDDHEARDLFQFLHSEVREGIIKWCTQQTQGQDAPKLDRWIDVHELITRVGPTHCDWEGFANIKPAIEATNKCLNDWIGIVDDVQFQDFCDIMLHFAYESLDQGDAISDYEMNLYAHAVYSMLNCRYWLKSRITWFNDHGTAVAVIPEDMVLEDDEEEEAND